MSTQVQENVGSTAWVDITTSLSLVDGQRYILQNISSYTVRLIESATEPALSDIGHILDEDICPWLVEQEAGRVFWIKSDEYVAKVVVTEAS